MTVHSRIPSPSLPSGAEAQPASAVSAGRMRRAEARKDVFAVRLHDERLSLGRAEEKEVRGGNTGASKAGAQHVGTGIGLGGIKERRLEGNIRGAAARKRVAVVKVIANATAKRSCRAV